MINILQEMDKRMEQVIKDHVDIDLLNTYNEMFKKTKQSLGMVI